jgi:hypothetical protein
VRARTAFAALGAGCAAGALAAAFVACGGDDNKGGGPPPDAGASDAASSVDVSFPDIGSPPPPVDAGWDAAACPGLASASPPDPAAVQRGLALVSQLGCANCHQSVPPADIVLSGRTDSLLDGGAVYPPNLTPDPATGLGCWTAAQIQNAILNGVDFQDASLCVMPLFGQRGVDAAAAADIAAFLQSLDAIANTVPPTTCPAPAPADAGVDAPAADAADASPG